MENEKTSDATCTWKSSSGQASVNANVTLPITLSYIISDFTEELETIW